MKGTTVVGTVLSIAMGLLAVSSVLRNDSDRELMAAKIKGLRAELPNISLYLEDDKAIKEVDKKVHIAFVLCGGGHRLDEAEVLVKSAVLHTKTDLHFSIFTDQHKALQPRLQTIATNIKTVTITFDYYSVASVGKTNGWLDGWGKCCGFRVYLPRLLPNHNHVIYVDTDVVFQDSPNNLWSFFKQMNATQAMALAPDNPQVGRSQYDQAGFPAPAGGLNSGVILMNLALMRMIKFEDNLIKIYSHLKTYFSIPDQDATNVFAAIFPNTLYRLPSSWNTHILVCSSCLLENLPLCPTSTKVSLFHGTQSTFHQPNIKIFFKETLARLFQMFGAQGRLTVLLDYFWYGIRDSLGLEPITVLQRIFNTYNGVHMNDICQTLEQQITTNWEGIDLTGYWCHQHVPEIVKSLRKVLKTHCT